MKLSPKAVRFVKEAIDGLPVGKRPIDLTGLSGELSADVIALARKAIAHSKKRMESELAKSSLSDDERSDLVNDLRYLMAIDKDLRHEIEPARMRA